MAHLRARAAGLVTEPLALIMVTAGIFEILSGDAISHAALLIVGAGLIHWDRTAAPGGENAGGTPANGWLEALRRVPVLALLAVAIVYAAVVGGFARFSWPITLAIVVPGLLLVVAVWRDTTPRPMAPDVDRRGIVWAVGLVSLGLWELAQLLQQPTLRTDSFAHPTLSVLLDPMLDLHRIDRSVAVFLWLVLGWYLQGL